MPFFLSTYRYLEEIGYTDALLDVRSSRVRSLLGIHTDKSDQMKDDVSNQQQQPSQSLSADSRFVLVMLPASLYTNNRLIDHDISL